MCANECPHVRICRDLSKECGYIRGTIPCGVEGFGIILEALSIGSEPVLNGSGGPFGRFVGVAIVASVWSAELCGQVGPWDSETMIVPTIDHHVGAHRHVAGRACERRIGRLVLVG